MNFIALSIILPVYNSEKFLKKTLDSCICKDKIFNYEIVCIDDSSKDKSLKIIKEFKRKYQNIKLIKNKKNIGVGSSRNLGIKKAKGKYLILLDSDDTIEKKNLALLIDLLKNKNKDLISANFKDFDEEEKNIFSFSTKNYLFEHLSKHQSINYCFPFIYNRKFLNKHNIFFEKFRYAEDFIFITKVFCLMNNFQNFNKLLINHRFNPNGLSQKLNIEYDFVYLYGIKVLDDFTDQENFNSKKLKYISLRKKNLFFNFILRSLKYKTNKIINYDKDLIDKNGKINLKDNLFLKEPRLNYLNTIKNIKYQILKFLGVRKNEKILIYGYGSIGKSLEKILIRIGYNNLFFFDDKYSKKLIRKENKNFISKTKIKSFEKVIISVPHKKIFTKIVYKLLKVGVKKNHIMNFFFNY